jgi:hypothetical protein
LDYTFNEQCTNSTTVLRNPLYFVFLLLAGVAAYVTWHLNLWGPMTQMSRAAGMQAVDIGKQKLREFLENNDGARRALGVEAKDVDSISMHTLDSRGKRKAKMDGAEDEEEDDL